MKSIYSRYNLMLLSRKSNLNEERLFARSMTRPLASTRDGDKVLASPEELGQRLQYLGIYP